METQVYCYRNYCQQTVFFVQISLDPNRIKPHIKFKYITLVNKAQNCSLNCYKSNNEHLGNQLA